MTKEECLNKHDTSRKYIEQTCRPELFAAMDEYAAQQAIEFVKWAIDAEKIVGDNWGIAFMPLMEEDVYNQFIEQQNKDNGNKGEG